MTNKIEQYSEDSLLLLRAYIHPYPLKSSDYVNVDIRTGQKKLLIQRKEMRSQSIHACICV